MKHKAFLAALMFSPVAGFAQSNAEIIDAIIDEHILPRFKTLEAEAADLSNAANAECAPTSEALRDAYGDAFDAWIAVSHLRFGPTEVNDRAFALAFWPDNRGATPRALNTLIAEADPIAQSVERYAEVSITARGFYALEYLLYDTTMMAAGNADYQCQLVQKISADIAATTAAINADWQGDYAAKLRPPGPDANYRDAGEVLQEAFSALTTGLQFTADARLGRPLGTFDAPRPARAESWRSGRSTRHVTLSLTALRDLAARLAQSDADLQARLAGSFGRGLQQLEELDDPVFAGVAEPQSRFKVEAVQTSINAIRTLVAAELGPTLGVAAGFNALNGD